MIHKNCTECRLFSRINLIISRSHSTFPKDPEITVVFVHLATAWRVLSSRSQHLLTTSCSGGDFDRKRLQSSEILERKSHFRYFSPTFSLFRPTLNHILCCVLFRLSSPHRLVSIIQSRGRAGIVFADRFKPLKLSPQSFN